MIYYDTREKPHAIKHILKGFDELGIKYERKKLDVGDYVSSLNESVVIERKACLEEILANLSGDIVRFEKEFKRAVASRKIVKIVVENNCGVKALEDVARWKNPNHSNSIIFLSGRELMERIHRLKIKFGVDVFFCSKEETPKMIARLLKEGI